MNAERLLAQFERISEAPDAIPRMRRFILDLAVRGKLVEQDPEDEPATELLQHIAAEKASRRSSKARNTPDERVEGWCPIPASWNFVRLDEVCTVIMGSSPPGSTYNKIGEGVPLINGPVEFTPGPFGLTTINQYTTAPSAFCEVGDFLICVRGSTTGRTNIAAFRACIGRGVASIQPLFKDKFIRLAIRVRQEAILQMGRGIAFPSISREQLSGLPVPLPPLAEQHRIVAKVDELMALCDQLEAARQERQQGQQRLVAACLQRLNQPTEDPESFRQQASFALKVLPRLTTTAAEIKQLRQTILNLAVRGKLVEQDPEDEPAEELLRCIAADRSLLQRTRGRLRNDEIKPIPSDLVPYELPQGWRWARFGDIMYSRDGERVPVSKDERSRRAKTYDYYGASGVIDKIDGFLFDKPLLLIGEDGANLLNRSTPIAFIARGRYWVNNHAHVLDGISEEFLRFIELTINATDLAPYVTGTAQPKMNQAKMNSIPVALPPLAEQHRIVAKVDELMALCDQLEQQRNVGEQLSRKLLEGVVQEALGEPGQAVAPLV